MKKLILLLLLLLSVSVYAQQAPNIGRFDGVVLPSGTPNGPANVAVCSAGGSGGPPCSPLAVIYGDQSGTGQQANPFTADINGRYTFFAPSGTYVVQTYGAGYTTTLTTVTISGPNNGGSGSGGSSSVNYQSVTPSTAASAIALGSGATNANSANGAAGVASLNMTLNINVGDFVMLFTDTQDASATVTDNGGNQYYQIGAGTALRGTGIIWYVPSATGTATTITVADAANVYTISGATYKNVLGVGAVRAPFSIISNSPSMSLTTTANNSLVVGCFQFNTATTFTASSGSIVTSSFNGTNTVNTAMMSIATTTAGSYTLSANSNQGAPGGQGLMLELLAASAVNQPSPTITLGGTGWNGSSSVNELTTLQATSPSITSPVPSITATPAFSVVNSGLFNDTANASYITSSINGSNSATEFQGVSRPANAFQNDAVYGGILIPASSTQVESNGLFGATSSYSSTTFAVGGYFSSRGLAASTKIFGSNSIAMDGGFAASQLVGTEIDITQSSADAAGVTAVSNGLRVLSNGSHRPASGVWIAGQNTTDNFLAPLLIDDSNGGDTNPTRMIYLIPPDNLNTTTALQLRNHGNNADVLTLSDAGAITPSLYQSLTNCAVNSVSPAACGAAPAGAVVIPTTTTTYVINTTAVTANSRIFLQPMTWASNLPSAPTCVAPASGFLGVSASTAGTSFTVTLPSTTGTVCLNYWIVN